MNFKFQISNLKVRLALCVCAVMLLGAAAAFGSGSAQIAPFAIGTVYATGAAVLDSNGNVELAQSPGGTSGSSIPAWPAVNHAVKDTSGTFYWLNAGAPVGTDACMGGSPQYCASIGVSQRMLRSAIIYPALDSNDGGPAMGIPFHDPDTGARITRVTDGMLVYGTGRGVGAATNITNSAAEAYSCSNFNPSIGEQGGYLCWYTDGGGGWSEFMVDKATMETRVLKTPRWVSENSGGTSTLSNEASSSWTDPWAFFTSQAALTFDAYCNPAIAGVIPATPTPDTFCGSTLDAPVALFTASSANCPNLPAAASGDLYEVQANSTDELFSGYANQRYAIVWNRANGHCDWYDTVANEVGGSDISGVQHTVGFYGFPTPLSMTAPSVGGSGGSFTTGAAYCFDETIVTRTEVKPGNFGEETTPGSTQCTAALTAGEEITLSRPPRGSDSISQDYVYIDSGAGGVPNGWNVYGCQEVAVGTPCAPNAIQNTSNEISWASGNTTLVSFASGGAAPPATNVAGYMIHQGRIAPAGNFVYFTGGGGDELGGAANTVFAWILNTETGWAANTAYVAGNVIKDSNGHLETAQDAFTSGSSAPAWSATTGGTTIDNGGTWMMSQGATNAVNLSYLGGHTVPAGGFVIFNNGGSTDPGGWNTDFEQIPLLGATVPAPHGGNYAGSRPVPGFSAAGDLHPSIGTDYGGADKVPFCASSDARGSTSIAMGGGTFPAPNGTTIRWPNSGFNPDWGVGAPGFGEIMCFAMDGSGKEWRFGHTRSSFAGDNKSSPAAGNWFASYVLGDVSRDGNLMIFTSSWAWDLGTANYWSWAPNISYTSGTVINDSNGNLETAGSNFTSGAVEPNWSKSVGGTTPDNGGTWTMKFGCPTVAACRWDVFVMELK